MLNRRAAALSLGLTAAWPHPAARADGLLWNAMPPEAPQRASQLAWELVPPQEQIDGSPDTTSSGPRPPGTLEEAQQLIRDLKLPSPLLNQGFQFPSAFQLLGDDFRYGANFRSYFPPKSIIPNSSTSVYAGWTMNLGLTDSTELGFAFSRVDSSMPGKQGPFFPTTGSADGGPGRSDSIYTLQLQQQLWKHPSDTQAVAAVVSASFGKRSIEYPTQSYSSDAIIPTVQLPYSISIGRAWHLTLAPTASFFQRDSALFLHTAPIANPGSFGTLTGLSSSLSYQINPRLIAWSDTFVPITGNNSFERSSGRPSKEIIVNAGLRYFVNPSLGLDLYASNSQGSMGAIGLLANPGQTSIGTNLVFLFDYAGHERYADTFKPGAVSTPLLKTGFGLYSGSVAPSRTLVADLAYGGQGFNGMVGYGFVNDLDLSLYLGYTSGTVDESEQGLAARVRLLNQGQGDPLTATLVGTIGKTNQPFLNYFNNNSEQFQASGLKKTVPWYGDLDSTDTGQLWILTASLPLVYQFTPKAASSSAIWITPTAGFVQRLGGLQTLGLSLGGSWAVTPQLSLIGEVGANFGNRDNGFIGTTLANLVPWSVGMRWSPKTMLGQPLTAADSRPGLYLYLTNQVGQTPWLSMRVRAQNEPTIGLGITIPLFLKF